MPLERLERGDKTIHLAEYIRGKTRDGKLLTDKLVAIVEDAKCSANNRIRAIELLFNRGWGRPKEEIAITIETRQLQNFSIEQLRSMLDNVVEGEYHDVNDRKLLPERMSPESPKYWEIEPKTPELTGDTQEC